MSNAPSAPEPPTAEPKLVETPPAAAVAPPAPDYEQLPETGVRKVLDALEERESQRIRWGAVIAGLVLAIGAQILLGTLGVAIGLAATEQPDGSLGLGAGIWMGVSSLIALFLGGFAAAKLGGAIRRKDGALSGLLTWSTSVVLMLWLIGAGASAAAGLFSMALPRAPLQRDPMGSLERGSIAATRSPTVERAAWGTLGGLVVSLIAAIAGGAAGASGLPDDGRRQRRDRDRELRDREAAFRAAREREWDREFRDRYINSRR